MTTSGVVLEWHLSGVAGPLSSRYLGRLQAWMAGQRHVVAITKPLYDRSAYDLGRTEPDRVVKPDFEGTIHTATGV